MTTRQDLHIRQGETWTFTWVKKDAHGEVVDLTGYTARCAMARSLNSVADAYLTTGSDSRGGSIVITGGSGTVSLTMSAEQGAALAGLTTVEDRLWGDHGMDPEDVVELRYDLALSSPEGVVTRELEGRVVVYREVTR